MTAITLKRRPLWKRAVGLPRTWYQHYKLLRRIGGNDEKTETEIAISFANKVNYGIGLHASFDAIEDFKTFGRIFTVRDLHILFVDRRYDFDEVLDYIKNYDKDDQ